MRENTIVVEGNLGDDAELRYTDKGAARALFRLAINEKVGEETRTTWLSVVAWGTLGENVAESLRKGDRAIVVGRISSRAWETKEGEKRTATEVVADSVGPSLRWATATVERQSKGE